MKIYLEHLKIEAKDLVDDGNNTEYLRGVMEIISSFIKSDKDHAEKAIDLAIELGISKENANKMYF